MSPLHSTQQRQSSGGFALVIALSLMAFVLLLLLSITTLVQVESQGAKTQMHRMEAEQAALLGLQVALGELQKAAGPDQRVTATASVLEDSSNNHSTGNEPVAGCAHWTGVWRSDTAAIGSQTAGNYDPANPDQRVFEGWLVSSPDSSGKNIGYAASAGLADSVTIFEGADVDASVIVPQVKIAADGGADRFYAYWVEDQSVKADLGWNEIDPSTGERKQALRLTSSAGLDPGVFSGPFAGKVTYPIEFDTSTTWLNSLKKAISTNDVPLATGAATRERDWLQSKRHDIAYGNLGVLADVKQGGLRRDLSLAFELDGDADMSAVAQPTKFNQQIGEFVGGSDDLAAPATGEGMPVPERFLYRVTKTSNKPHVGDIINSDAVIRGPNWWALRDFANLYKRLSGSGGAYEITARSHYPNYSATGSTSSILRNVMGINTGATPWDREYATQRANRYVFRPAAANYAPILLGSVALFSTKVIDHDGTQGNLALGIDPFFYLWNPYNRTMNVPKYAVRLSQAFGGHIQFNITDSTTNVVRTVGPATITKYVTGRLANWDTMSYLISDLVMEPGEIVIVSPGLRSSGSDPSATMVNDIVQRGTNMTDSTGLIVDNLPIVVDAPTPGDPDGKAHEFGQVAVSNDDQIECIYTNLYGSYSQTGVSSITGYEHFWIDAYLPVASANASSIRQDSNIGEHLQQLGGNLAGYQALPDRFEPPRSSSLPAGWVWPTVRAGDGVNTKQFFGVSAYLAKPADFDWSEPDVPQNPIDVFTQFNPWRMCTPTELWRPSALNDTYSGISKETNDPDTLTDALGVNFPGTTGRGFWGQSYKTGTQIFTLGEIPSAPILSLADFSNANLSIRAAEPFKVVGNSRANVLVPNNTLYKEVGGASGGSTASDSSWLINDALFDRYYLSGIAPEFSLAGGYSATGSVNNTLDTFFGATPEASMVNPALVPYLPLGMKAYDAVAALGADDGYLKTGAFSMIRGAFNVNSTSVEAWAALLRANKDLVVDYAQSGSSESSLGTPFPSGTGPIAPGTNKLANWNGFSRISDSDIWDGKGTDDTSDDTGLAAEIVKQVKLRGPFMSISDFVNRRIGSSATVANDSGALQTAIDAVAFNESVRTSAGGVAPDYPTVNGYNGTPYYHASTSTLNQNTASGIPGDITQADVLRPIAPRLTARSDTFSIRAYGDVWSHDGTKVVAKAMCEATVQRLPDYLDSSTNAGDNEAWDEEAGNPQFNSLNSKFGRRFEIVSFRWLAQNEL